MRRLIVHLDASVAVGHPRFLQVEPLHVEAAPGGDQERVTYQFMAASKQYEGSGHERQLAAGELAGDGLAGSLLPPGLRLPVVHDQAAVAQPPGGAKVQHPPLKRPLEGDASVAEGTVAHGDRHSPTVSLTISCHIRIWMG